MEVSKLPKVKLLWYSETWFVLKLLTKEYTHMLANYLSVIIDGIFTF